MYQSKIRGNHKYGLSIADRPEGSCVKCEGNPIISYPVKGNNIQAEENYMQSDEEKLRIILRDTVFLNKSLACVSNRKMVSNGRNLK